MKKIYWLLISACFIYACKNNCEKDVDLSGINGEVNIIRTEKELFEINSPATALQWMQKYPDVSTNYFQRSAFPHDSLLANYLYKFYSNKELKDLYKASDSTFGDLSAIKSNLQTLFQHIKFYYPKFYIPKVYTIVSGFQFDKDIYISDSVIVVSIDYFLGKKAKYRPPFYSYFLERYEKEYIVPMISLAVSSKFNVVDLKDETMLANMIFYGKAYYFSKKVQPCIPDSLLVQYSSQQLEDIHNNQEIIWGHFIQNKLLFETKPQLIEKYIGESPRINEIGEKCPGRIGRWLGWEIVKSYIEQYPEMTLQELMAEKDAQKIFRLSKYKPQYKK